MKKFILILFLITLQFANAKNDTILFLGDSLTEGLGVTKEDAFPKLVETMIQTKLKKDVTVINGGVSGSTTSDGLDRLKWYMKKKPSIVFLALGANDGLRGFDLKQSQENLEEIINVDDTNHILNYFLPVVIENRVTKKLKYSYSVY